MAGKGWDVGGAVADEVAGGRGGGEGFRVQDCQGWRRLHGLCL